VIFSESLSVLISIKNKKKSDNIMIQKLFLFYDFMNVLKNKICKIILDSKYVGIRGNEKVDA
jgi:hypothetical protein